MTNLMILKLLLSFCNDVDYKFMCRHDMRSCFNTATLRGVEGETAFRNCLDENYVRIFEGRYDSR